MSNGDKLIKGILELERIERDKLTKEQISEKVIEIFGDSDDTEKVVVNAINDCLGNYLDCLSDNIIRKNRMINDLNDPIKEFYNNTFPDDEVGEYLDETATFGGMLDTIKSGGDIYEYLGNACDSVIRERLFTKLSDLMGYSYERLYDIWVSNINH